MKQNVRARAAVYRGIAASIAAKLSVTALHEVSVAQWKALEKRVEAVALAAAIYGGARLRYAHLAAPMPEHEAELREAAAALADAIEALATLETR